MGEMEQEWAFTLPRAARQGLYEWVPPGQSLREDSREEVQA